VGQGEQTRIRELSGLSPEFMTRAQELARFTGASLSNGVTDGDLEASGAKMHEVPQL